MKQKEINGVTFTVAPFKAVEALKLKSFLVKKFGPSLGQALGALNSLPQDENFADLKLDGAALSQAIEKLMEQLNEQEFIDLIKRLFKNVTASLEKEGKSLQFSFVEQQFETAMDVVFTGQLFSVYPVLLFVFEVNYPDFFDKVAPVIGSRIQKIITSGPEKEESKNESGKSET